MYREGETQGPLRPTRTGIVRVRIVWLWIREFYEKLPFKIGPCQNMIRWTLMGMIPPERLEETTLYVDPHGS